MVMRTEGNHTIALEVPVQLPGRLWECGDARSFCGRGVKASPGQEQPAGWFVTGRVFTVPSSCLRGKWWIRVWSTVLGVRWGLNVSLTCWTRTLINYMALWTYFPRSKLSELLWEITLMPMKYPALYLTCRKDSIMLPFLPMWSSYCRMIICGGRIYKGRHCNLFEGSEEYTSNESL